VAWQTWRRQAPHWWQPATLGVHIPMPIRNNVARLQDRNEDLNFDHEETINGSPCLVYKPMGLFMHDGCLCGRSDETHQRDDRWSSMEGKGWRSPSPVKIVLTVGCANHSSTFGTCIRPSWGAV
jgi:hypothetical protein